MKFNAMVIAALLTTVSVGMPLQAQNKEDPQTRLDQVIREQEMLNQDVSLRLAPIKSNAALEQHLRKAGASSPIAALSGPAKRRFISSLKFNERGITSFSYGDLQSELTASQIYQIMSLFGAQHTVALMRNVRVQDAVDEQIMRPLVDPPGPTCPSQPCDYESYECIKTATCSYNINTICMRNC